jgi:hypothetical protein
MLIPARRVTDVDKKTAVIANAVGTGAYYMGVGGVIIPGATGHVFAGTSPNITPFITGATSSSALILGVITALITKGHISEQSNVLGVNAAETGSSSVGPGTDNETYKVWSVEYIPAYIPMEYIADFSAALGTTTDSGANAYFGMTGIDTTSGDDGVVLESSGVIYSATRTAKCIFLSGPAGSSKKGYVHFQGGLTI